MVTSHVSPRFLQGLFIGYVSDIEVDANNLTRSGYITPAVDFSKLQEVLVITTTKKNLLDANNEQEPEDAKPEAPANPEDAQAPEDAQDGEGE